MRATSIPGKLVMAAALVAAAGAVQADGDAKRGQKLYDECVACHALEGGAREIGPSLKGMFGRKAAEAGDFRYSPAMKRSGITWTAPTLDAFLADPQKAVPANRMPYSGMPDARDRADLITYMQAVLK